MPQARQYHSFYYTIPAGASYAVAPIDLREMSPVSLIIPAAWTAAAISFSGSPSFSDPPDFATYGWLASVSAKVIRLLPVNANNLYQLSPGWFEGVNWLFIVSGDLTFGVAGLVNQAAERQLQVNCRDRFATMITA